MTTKTVMTNMAHLCVIIMTRYIGNKYSVVTNTAKDWDYLCLVTQIPIYLSLSSIFVLVVNNFCIILHDFTVISNYTFLGGKGTLMICLGGKPVEALKFVDDLCHIYHFDEDYINGYFLSVAYCSPLTQQGRCLRLASGQDGDVRLVLSG